MADPLSVAHAAPVRKVFATVKAAPSAPPGVASTTGNAAGTPAIGVLRPDAEPVDGSQ